jgi:hypothetical protein
VSAGGDFKKIRRAEHQGWRVEKRKEYWLFFPPHRLERVSKPAVLPHAFMDQAGRRGMSQRVLVVRARHHVAAQRRVQGRISGCRRF